MKSSIVRTTRQSWIVPACLLAVYACGSSGSEPKSASATGGAGSQQSCTLGTDCASGLCRAGQCLGSTPGTGPNTSCTSGTTCASQQCVNGQCTAPTNLAPGSTCTSAAECQSQICLQGKCGPGGGSGGAAGQGGSSSTGTALKPFAGMGTDWRPLTPGCGPDTARQCGGACEAAPNTTGQVIRPPALFCFGASSDGGILDPTPDDPAAIIEQTIETLNGVSFVHIRVTFDPAFVDNTYGANASAGWFATVNGKTGKGHTFSTDLTNSDHIDLLLTDGTGATVMQFGEDYIHSLTATPKKGTGGSPSLPDAGIGCGYANLGVTGGDGEMILGKSTDVLAVASSIDRNLSGCGYCQSAACTAGTTGIGDGDCTINSPATDSAYTPNPLTPKWNYAVVYEVWINAAAFGSAGFGQAYITYVHASPSKAGQNTLYVEPTPCPPRWFECPPGQTCPPSGAGGVGAGGQTAGCPPNWQARVTTEGADPCTPIPFAGWPNRAACPEGWELDTASEGRYCKRSV